MRIVNLEDKKEVLARATKEHFNVCYLAILYKEKGEKDKASQFEMRDKRLTLEIDNLLHELYREWIGEAGKVKDSLKTSNAGLEECVQEIKKNINDAQNFVRGLNYADEGIAILKGLL